MDDLQKQEWSRHYDSVQWTVTAILVAAIGGLLVYCSDEKKYDTLLAVFGIVLTLSSSFFAASFRALRLRLHIGLEDEEIEPYLRSRGLLC